MPSEEGKPTCDPVAAETGEARPTVTLGLQDVAWVEDRRLSFYVLLVIGGIVAYLTFLILRPFLTALFLAMIMAVAFFPLHRWLATRIRRGVSAFLTTIFALVLVMVPFAFISIRIVTEAGNFYGSVLQPLGNPTTWPSRMDPVLHDVSEMTGIPAESLKAEVTSRIRDMGTSVVGLAASAGRRFAQQIGTLFLAAFFLFPILRYSDEFRAGTLSMLPLPAHRARELGVAINQGIIADIYGMLAVGIGEGLLVAAGFWAGGIRAPLLWGFVATILSCLPFFGVSLVWIPACVLLALRGNYTAAVLLFLFCVLVVSTAEGIIRSSVVSGRVRVNPMLITLSIMGGVAAFGAVGIFAGPVVLVLVGTLVRILREEHASTQHLQAAQL